MQDVEGGIKCMLCGHFEPVTQGPLPPEFEGPSIHGG